MELTSALPFAFLWLALGTAMIPRARQGWSVLVGLSIVAAVGAGIVEWTGLAAIALFAGACLAAVRCSFSKSVRVFAWVVLLACSIAFATHQMPWINNVLVFDAVRVSPLSAPYTLYWNYDKALAGVLLYAVCVQPQREVAWRNAIIATSAIAVLTTVLVAIPALAAKFVLWDPKWPVILLLWVPANLLVTCVAEEAFFRGVLQRHLTRALRTVVPSAGLVALFLAAAAFGVAHIGGGAAYAILAAVAGIGYGAAYYATQRVEASILVHFILNLTHLFLFTYPFIAAD